MDFRHTHIETETFIEDVPKKTTWYLPPKPIGGHFDNAGNSSQVSEIGSFDVQAEAKPLVDLILGPKQPGKPPAY